MTSILEFYSLADPEAGISKNSTAISLNFTENSSSELKERLIHAGSCLSDTLSEIWDAPVMWRLAHCTEYPELCEDKDFEKFSDAGFAISMDNLNCSQIESFDDFSKKIIELDQSLLKRKTIFTEFNNFPVLISSDTRLGFSKSWYGSFGSKVLVSEANTRSEAVELLVAALKVQIKKLVKCW